MKNKLWILKYFKKNVYKRGRRMKRRIGDLTLREAEELRNCCEHIGFIKVECWDCKYFDENKCDCKLSFLAYLRKIDLEQEIEVEE